MSDSILEALVQLFAIVASVRGAADMSERRQVVFNFLVLQLNQELANKYIAKFDDYYQQNIKLGKRSENQYKTISRVSTKVMRIVNGMNKEMSLYQKYVVLVELYEYLNTGQISYVEQGLVHDVVADKFNIDQDEFEKIRDFILTTQEMQSRIVFSGEENCEEIAEPRHVYWPDLGGELSFVYLGAVNIFIFKSLGNDTLEMNGTHVLPGRTYMMRPGNSIRNSICAPIFFYDMMRQVSVGGNQPPITMEARNVEYWFNKQTIGLHKFSFESHSGRMVGIMGVSGSGKSTFANVISGMARPAQGNVYINNIDIYEHPEEVKGIVGVVAQDDILFEDLTVYENLYYSARMSFDNLPMPAIHERIDKLLRLLGLYEVKDIKVGSPLNKKISGGQRKRLNIALELIREPAILILDEPTSGLSSHDSENIIALLKDLSINGKLIYVIIHQPSSDIFKLFDQLLLLDTGGYLIYDGNPVESVSYFRKALHMSDYKEVECPKCGNVNVEQILNMISQPVVDEYGNNTPLRKVSPEEWYEKAQWGHIDTNYVGDPEPLPEITFKIPGPLKQFELYLQRDVKSKLANLQYILLNFLEAPVMGVFVALLLRYYNVSNPAGYCFADNCNMPVYIVVAVIIAFFLGLTVAAEEIIQDRQMLKRERFLNLSRTSYIFSKCAQVTVLSALQMTLFVLVCNAILAISDVYWEYWIALFSTAVCANLIGLILSDCMKKTINIYVMIPFMVIPQLILSGVFVKFDKMNPDLSAVTGVPIYGNVIAARWAFEALAVNQFCYNPYEMMFYRYEKAKSQCSFYKDYWVPTMRSRLNRVTKNSHDPSHDPEEIAATLELLHNEIEVHSPIFPDIKAPKATMFAQGIFGPASYNVVNDYLDQVRKFNVARYNKTDEALDNFRKRFSAEELDSMRRKYHNQSIADLVTSPSGYMSEVITEYKGRLYHKSDYVFQNTDDAFMAPLYSPYKTFFGVKIDTYVFDILVLWFLNLLLLVVLLDGRLGVWLRK